MSENMDEYDRSQKAHSYPGSAPRYAQLYEPPQLKQCYFYKDGDPTFPALKLTINRRNYHDMEVLKGDLSRRVRGLPFGVRSIYTPMGRNPVRSMDQLEPQGNYVCSTFRNQAKGVDLAAVAAATRRAWQGGRPPSGRRAYNQALRDTQREQIHQGSTQRRPAWGSESDRMPKKITVFKNGDEEKRHMIILNRKTTQTFEDVIVDIGHMFDMTVDKVNMFTQDGRPIKSLSAIFRGPDNYVVMEEGETFKPSTAPALSRVTQPRRQSRKPYVARETAAHKLKEKREKLSKTRGKWKVQVTTNELPAAGTPAQVTITAYGHKGASGPLPLGFADGETFQAGSQDQFEISVGNIGEIYKIRIAHDNTGEYPGWFCDEVRMKDMHTAEELIFKCQRWLSREEDDAEICRELPAVRDNEPSIPIIQYEVTACTGELWNAGTNANVYITMYGERGDTGVRQLFKSNRSEKFRMGQVDTFIIEAVQLGNLKRVIVGHDGTAPGDGWFLEKLVVKEGVRARFEWMFPCSKWLDEGEGDNKIVRELKPHDQYNQDVMEKQRFEFEKWKYAPDCRVLLYSKSSQQALRVNTDATIDTATSEKDSNAVFRVITKKGLVRVLQNEKIRKYHLAIDNAKMQGQGRGGSYCEFRVRVQEDRSTAFESCKYLTQHLTLLPSGKPGDPRGPLDPTKEFFVYCKGMLRDEGVLIFWTSLSQTLNVDHDNMLYATGKRNKLAQFRVHKIDEGGIRMFESVVFPNQYIRFRDGQCDLMGTGDQYCHFKVSKRRDSGFVTVESMVSRGLYMGMAPDGRVRPTVDTGEKNVRFYPEVVQFGNLKRRSVSPEPAPIISRASKPPRHLSPSPQVTPRSHRTPTPRERTPTPRKETRRETRKKEEKKEKKETKEKKEEKTEERPDSAKSVYEDGDWKVWITTAEAAENADIAMVVYGGQGNSGPIILGRASDGALFQGNHVDEFKVNLANVGIIFKVRIELNPVSKKRDPLWKPKEVKMQDMHTHETLKFKFNRWLSRKHDDGDLMRELPAVRPKQKVLPLNTYQIHTYTGDEPGADTDANVYILLFGERGDTGKRHLLRSNNETAFQEGQVDQFELEAVDLGAVKRCVVSHDGEGAGEGWYCKQVIIKESTDAKQEYVFACNKWFDTSLDDKKIERMLKLKEDEAQDSVAVVAMVTPDDEERRPVAEEKEEEAPEEEPPKEGEWRVWVTTGRDEAMETTNEVSLYAYGADGVSEAVTLGTGQEGQLFQRGNTDEFKVDLGVKLGELYKIRLGCSMEQSSSGWFLEKVKMKNLTSEEVFTFRANRWLCRHEEDMDVWRELPVVRPGTEPLPGVVYMVEVYTGDLPGADTEAQLYITLYGTRGDSGRRLLYNSRNHDSKFQRGQVDVFALEAVSLDDVTKVVIGHNEKGKGAGWHCDHVMVKEGDSTEARLFYFPCEKWFDAGEDGGTIERELLAADPPKQSKGEFKVWVHTHVGSKLANGSRAVITLYGEKDKSEDLLLEGEGDLFAPGQVNEFEISAGDIGELYKIRISRQDADRWEGWYVERIRIQDKDTEEDIIFEVDRWLDRDQDDHDIVRELPVVKEDKETLPVYHYEVSLFVGDHWAADTDTNVYITLYGENGDSGKRWLTHPLDTEDKFQRAQEDKFLLEAVTLRDLKRIVLGHDGVGSGAGMHLDHVEIKVRDGPEPSKLWVFPCGRWLDDHMEDRKTERELRLTDVVDSDNPPPQPKEGVKSQGEWEAVVKTSDVHNAGTHAQVSLTVYGDKGHSDPQPLGTASSQDTQFDRGQEATFPISIGDIGELYKVRVEHDNSNDFPAWHLQQLTLKDKHTDQQLVFYVNRWLAADEEDGQLCRELPVSIVTQPTLPVLQYFVAVYTGRVKEAATTANVFITLHGTKGDSGKRSLSESVAHAVPWLAGQVDVFTVPAVSLGQLSHLTLEHDGQKSDTAWYVDHVVVRESKSALQESVFQCGAWLEPGDGASKDLPLTAEQPSESLPANEELLLNKDDTPSSGTWDVTTTTGLRQQVPTIAMVTLYICGTQGTSDPIPLMNEDDNDERDGDEESESSKDQSKNGKDKSKNGKDQSKNGKDQSKNGKQKNSDATDEKDEPMPAKPKGHTFSPGIADKFKASAADIGPMTKIRLVMDMPASDIPQWFLKQIKFKDPESHEEFHFHHNNWFWEDVAGTKTKDTPPEGATAEDDDEEGVEADTAAAAAAAAEKPKPPPQAVLELAAVRPDAPPLDDISYMVSLTTGSEPLSDTKATMYCQLTGSLGDTGKRYLVTSDNDVTFQKGATDVFEVTAVDVGKVSTLMVGHDGRGRGKGWFCQKGALRAGHETTTELVFPCNSWFDTGMGDRKTERILKALGEVGVGGPDDDQIESQGEFKVEMKMGDTDENNGNSNNNSNNSNNLNNNNGSVDVGADQEDSESVELPASGVVSLTVFGDKGMAGPFELDPTAEDLSIHAGDAGNVTKVRVSSGQHLQPEPVWNVQEISLQDVHTKQKLVFDFTPWMGEKGGDTSKELPALRPNADPLQLQMYQVIVPVLLDMLTVLEYQVIVSTGPERTEATEENNSQQEKGQKGKADPKRKNKKAEKKEPAPEPEPMVFINLLGSQGDCGPRHLVKNKEGSAKFKKGKEDVFTLAAVDLGDVDKVMVTKLPGDVPWLLHKVLVKKEQFAPTEQEFVYDKEFTAGSEPTQVELPLAAINPSRTTLPRDQCPDLPQSRGVWNVWTTTGSDEGAGSTAPVYVVLVGDQAESQQMTLLSESDDPLLLQASQRDHFKVQVEGELGEITKVRVGFVDAQEEASWNLQQLEFEDEDTGDGFTIEVGESIRADEEEEGWKEYPVMWPGMQPISVKRYTVEVYTGDIDNSGTNANVYIILDGSLGNSGKRFLKKSKNNTNKFESGQMDEFQVEGVDLGDLTKVTMGHDGSGPGSGWFLDKVVIKEKLEEEKKEDEEEIDEETDEEAPEEVRKNKEFVFECNRWLDEGEDDGAMERVLLVAEEKEDKGDAGWQAVVEMGPEQQEEVTATMVMVVYGDQGHTEEVILLAEGDENLHTYSPGSTNTFKIEDLSSVGEVYKVRVGLHDDTDDRPSLQVAQIRLENAEEGQVLEFLIGGAVCETEDKDSWVEAPLSHSQTEDTLPVLTYQVELKTGDVMNAGTNANVYAIIYGERGDTGRRKLLHSNNTDKFEQGQTDMFEIAAVDLGEVKKVVVGHDGKGAGSGWFLEQAVVKELNSDNSVVFQCNRWFDEGEDDYEIERELLPGGPLPQPEEEQDEDVAPEENEEHLWKVWTVTGQEEEDEEVQDTEGEVKDTEAEGQGKTPAMPSSGQVVLVIYGSEGKSQELPLMADKEDTFKPGQTDEFDLRLDNAVGEPYKVRVGYTAGSKDIRWKLLTVILRDMEKDKEYTFDLNDLVVVDSTQDGWREIPVEPETPGEHPEDVEDEEEKTPPKQAAETLPVHMYQVAVHMGEMENAGTTANMHLTIYGERGDTGQRSLLKTTTEDEHMFQEGQVCMFEVEAVDLAGLQRVVVLHDGTEAGDGCFIQHIIIKHGPGNTARSFFPCDRWLDVGQDDGLTQRELHISDMEHTWKLLAVTAPPEEGTEETSTEKDKNNKDSKGKKDGKSKKDDQKKKKEEPAAPNIGQVVVVVYGSYGKSEQLPLVNEKQDNFKAGETDEYDLLIERDLGDLYKVRIGYADDVKPEQKWNLQNMVLRDQLTDREYKFESNGLVWRTDEAEGWRELPLTPAPPPSPSDNEVKSEMTEDVPVDKTSGEEAEAGDKDTKPKPAEVEKPLPVYQYEVEVHTGEESSAGTSANVYLTIVGERGDTGKRKLLKAVNHDRDKFKSGQMDVFYIEAVDLLKPEKVVIGHDGDGAGSGWYLERVVIRQEPNHKKKFVFPCSRWLDEGEDDGLLERQLDVMDPAETWNLTVTTADVPGAECAGQVSLVLYGDLGYSEPITLGEEQGAELQQGSFDTVTVKVRPAEGCDGIGLLYKVRVGLMAADSGSDDEGLTWGLDLLTAARDGSVLEHRFDFQDQIKLSTDSDSWREIAVSSENDEQQLKVHQYVVEVYTDDRAGAGTDALVHMQVYGERGDTGRRLLLQSQEEGSKFESGKKDKFTMEAVDLGPLQRVIVGHNGSGWGSGWYLGKVVIKDAEDAQLSYLFNCDRWLDEGEDDGLLERELELTKVLGDEAGEWKIHVMTSEIDNSGTDAQVWLTVFGEKGDSGRLPLGEPSNGLFESGSTDEFDVVLDPEVIGEKVQKIRVEHDNPFQGCGWHLEKLIMEQPKSGEKLEFTCGRWLDEDEDDGGITRELLPDGDESSQKVTIYEVKTVTGSNFGSGTDAHVFITLHGEKGDSGKRGLRKSVEGKNKFEKKKTDTFLVEAIDLGPLVKVTIGHDGQGSGAGWYLDKVLVKETVTGEAEYTFPCDRWLDEDEDDKKTERELYVDGKEPDEGKEDKEEDEDDKDKEEDEDKKEDDDKEDDDPKDDKKDEKKEKKK